MADQVGGNTTPQPAASTPAAPTAPVVSGDTLWPVKVDGRDYQEPISKLAASYQLQSAAERRFQEAGKLLTQHKGDIELAQRIKSRIQADPEGAILEMKQFAEQQLGRPVRLPGAPAYDGDGGTPTAADEARVADARRSAEIRELRAELQGMKTSQRVDTTEREIDAEISKYPMWRNSDTEQGQRARELAKLTISAMKGSQPDMAVSDLASEVHQRFAGLLTQEVTQVRDQRQLRAETMPVAPTQGGTPAMTTATPDGWGTKKALRDGSWQAKLREFMAQSGRTR